jgi:hypothetical protein
MQAASPLIAGWRFGLSGVACELVFIIWAHIDGMHEWRSALTRAMTPLATKPSGWKLIFELLSVASLSLELWESYELKRCSAKLGVSTNMMGCNPGILLFIDQHHRVAASKRRWLCTKH